MLTVLLSRCAILQESSGCVIFAYAYIIIPHPRCSGMPYILCYISTKGPYFIRMLWRPLCLKLKLLQEELHQWTPRPLTRILPDSPRNSDVGIPYLSQCFLIPIREFPGIPMQEFLAHPYVGDHYIYIYIYIY